VELKLRDEEERKIIARDKAVDHVQSVIQDLHQIIMEGMVDVELDV